MLQLQHAKLPSQLSEGKLQESINFPAGIPPHTWGGTDQHLHNTGEHMEGWNVWLIGWIDGRIPTRSITRSYGHEA